MAVGFSPTHFSLTASSSVLLPACFSNLNADVQSGPSPLQTVSSQPQCFTEPWLAFCAAFNFMHSPDWVETFYTSQALHQNIWAVHPAAMATGILQKGTSLWWSTFHFASTNQRLGRGPIHLSLLCSVGVIQWGGSAWGADLGKWGFPPLHCSPVQIAVTEASPARRNGRVMLHLD